jgi:hypothetical protein
VWTNPTRKNGQSKQQLTNNEHVTATTFQIHQTLQPGNRPQIARREKAGPTRRGHRRHTIDDNFGEGATRPTDGRKRIVTLTDSKQTAHAENNVEQQERSRPSRRSGLASIFKDNPLIPLHGLLRFQGRLSLSRVLPLSREHALRTGSGIPHMRQRRQTKTSRPKLRPRLLAVRGVQIKDSFQTKMIRQKETTPIEKMATLPNNETLRSNGTSETHSIVLIPKPPGPVREIRIAPGVPRSTGIHRLSARILAAKFFDFADLHIHVP